jgi:hypothetical protein
MAQLSRNIIIAQALVVGIACSRTSIPSTSAAIQPESVALAAPGAVSSQAIYAGSFEEKSTPGSKAVLKITERIRSSSVTVNGQTLESYEGTETDTAGKRAPFTIRFTADAKQSKSAIRAGSDVDLLAETYDGGGTFERVDDGIGNGIANELPEVPQAAWINSATRRVSISIPNNDQTLTVLYDADGAYRETSVPVEGRTAASQTFADGNAVYQWPFEAVEPNAGLTFEAPDRNRITVQFADSAIPATVFIRFRDWYPTTPPALASDDTMNMGVSSIPSECGVPKRYGSTATQLEERSSRLDLVFGQFETATRIRYVEPHYGLVCLLVRDDLASYYNFTAIVFSARPLNTIETTEVIGLRSSSQKWDPALSVALPLDARLSLSQASSRMSADEAVYQSRRRLESRQ